MVLMDKINIQGDLFAAGSKLSAIKPLSMNWQWSKVVGTYISSYETAYRHITRRSGRHPASMHNWTRCSRFFGYRVISKDHCPTRSPDFTPPDFFPVHTNKPHTTDDLEQNIRQQTAAIPADMLQRVFANLKHRFRLCMDAGGNHFQHLTWRAAVSQVLRNVPTTFDHHRSINIGFIAESL